MPDKSLDDAPPASSSPPLRDAKTPESPALAADGAASLDGRAEWESEDDTLYVEPRSRRLSVCASEVAFDLPASPVVGVDYMRPMAHSQQDDPEVRSS